MRPPVYEALRVLAQALLAAGRSVVLDANYLDPERRREVREALGGTPTLSVQVTCSLASRLSRNRVRGGDDRVPDERVRVAHERAAAAEGEADIVIDTDLVEPEAAAERLVRWMRREGG
jgi:predicted kinase